MHPVYFETRFRVPHVDVIWPLRFAILSAFASTGQIWTDEQNQTADKELELLIERMGIWYCRVVGYSPTTHHAEPSWAVDIDIAQAREIGNQFRQDAFYYVEDDQLAVLNCQGYADSVWVSCFSDRIDCV